MQLNLNANERSLITTHAMPWAGFYCGEISTSKQVLEQILLIASKIQGSSGLSKSQPRDLSIVFTSFYSWYELPYIEDQRSAIREWDQKSITCEGSLYRLNLLHYNIPWKRFPTPAETKAVMCDMNDEAWISMTALFFKQLHIQHAPLFEIAERINSLRCLSNHYFLEREKALRNEIDAFRSILPSIIRELNQSAPSPLVIALKALYSKKTVRIDRLILLDYVLKSIGYLHNKNSRNTKSRIAGAIAADKAQYAFQSLKGKFFLPVISTDEEKNLFKILYRQHYKI